jgi:hypothetical protein
MAGKKSDSCVIINANVKVVNSASQQNGKCKSHEKFIPE